MSSPPKFGVPIDMQVALTDPEFETVMPTMELRWYHPRYVPAPILQQRFTVQKWKGGSLVGVAEKWEIVPTVTEAGL